MELSCEQTHRSRGVCVPALEPRGEGEDLRTRYQGFKPDLRNSAVRHYRGASETVAMAELRTHLATERVSVVTLRLTQARPSSIPTIDQLSKRVDCLLSNVTRLDCCAHGKNERKGWPKPDALCGSGGVWQFCRPFLPPRQTFESDVLVPVSSPFCHSPPPESREIANELAHGLLSSIRVCGKCAGTQYKTSLNQPKTQMLNAMFSRL
jgi:hypothetical protein